jgi:hypothetical protein
VDVQSTGLFMRIAAAIGCAVMLLGVGTTTGHAEKRVALVIGNGTYKNAPRLPNPINDAHDVSAALKRNGFDTIVGVDLDKAGMDDAAIRFSRAARDVDVAMFYYSGHAMQMGGVNYLLPVDAKLTDEADLRRMARVDELIADLQQARKLRILVLDSCRDNPLAEALKRSIGLSRAASMQRGLARIDTPQGMIVAYATQAGRTAEDGAGRNSPYTVAFLRHIEAPDEIGTVFRRISTDVYEATNHTQLPELSMSLIGEFYFRGKIEIGTTTSRMPSVPPAAVDPCAVAAEHWRSVQAIGTIAAFEDHLGRFSYCAFAGLAKTRLEELRKLQALGNISPQPPQAPRIPSLYGPPAAPETERTRVSAFTYRTPSTAVDPGLRIFTRETDGSWSEKYPSGHVARGSQVRARIVLDGCNGSVIGPPDEPDFAVFIPDKGCRGMMARWRRGAGHWNVLGPMENVR